MTGETVERGRNIGALVAAMAVLLCLWQAGRPTMLGGGSETVATDDASMGISEPVHGEIALLDEWLEAVRDFSGRVPPPEPEQSESAEEGSTPGLPIPTRKYAGYVLIDPGHGGRDGGAVGNGMIEKNVTLDVSKMLKRELDDRGILSRLTRDRDMTMSLMDRCAMANRGGDAVFVSVHVNSIAGEGASGIETFYCQPRSTLVEAMNRVRHPRLREEHVEDRRSRLLAGEVQRRLVAETGGRDRGIKNKPLAVVRHTEAPAILVECGFLSDEDEAKLLASDSYRTKLVEGMADGIEHFLETVAENPDYGFIENQPDEAVIDSAES